MPNPINDSANAAHGRRGRQHRNDVFLLEVHVGHRRSRQLSFMATAALCVPVAEHTDAGWFPVMAHTDAVR